MDVTLAFYRKRREGTLLLLLLLLMPHVDRCSAVDTDLSWEAVNLSCLVHNWKNMTCTWSLEGRCDGVNNVTSRLYYLISGSTRKDCPQPGRMLNTCICTWPETGVGALEKDMSYCLYLNVTRYDTNLTKALEEKTIFTTDIVVPDPVMDLQQLGGNHTCVTLRWRHSDHSHPKTVTVSYVSRCHFPRHQNVNFTDSPHTETLCALRSDMTYNVSVIVHGYRNSTPNDVIVRTAASNWRSFYCLRRNTTVIYWKTRQDCERLQYYKVLHVLPTSARQGQDHEVKARSWLELPLDRHTDHKLEVITVLDDGQPLFAEPQTIFVPSIDASPPPVSSVILETDFESSYLVTWTCDDSCNASAESFLVVLCPGNTTSMTCNDHTSLQWYQVKSSERHFLGTLTPEGKADDFIFGVVVQDTSGNVSGVTWEKCKYPLDTPPLECPSNVTVATAGTDELLVTWVSNYTSQNASCKTSGRAWTPYVYQYEIKFGFQQFHGHGVYRTEQFVDGSVTMATLQGLQPDVLYHVSLVAHHTPGVRRLSSPESPRQLARTPPLPKPQMEPQPIGALVAGVVAVVLILISIVVVVCYYCKKRITEEDSKFAPYLFTGMEPSPIKYRQTQDSLHAVKASSEEVPDRIDSCQANPERPTDPLLPRDPQWLTNLNNDSNVIGDETRIGDETLPLLTLPCRSAPGPYPVGQFIPDPWRCPSLISHPSEDSGICWDKQDADSKNEVHSSDYSQEAHSHPSDYKFQAHAISNCSTLNSAQPTKNNLAYVQMSKEFERREVSLAGGTKMSGCYVTEEKLRSGGAVDLKKQDEITDRSYQSSTISVPDSDSDVNITNQLLNPNTAIVNKSLNFFNDAQTIHSLEDHESSVVGSLLSGSSQCTNKSLVSDSVTMCPGIKGTPGSVTCCPDKKVTPSFVTNCPESKVTSGYVTSCPDNKVTPTFVDSFPGSKVKPSLQTSCPDSNVAPGYVTRCPDSNVASGYATNCPESKSAPSYVTSCPDSKVKSGYVNSSPESKMTPGWVFNSPDLQVTQGYVNSCPDNKVTPSYVTSCPDNKVTPSFVTTCPASKVTSVYVTTDPDNKVTPNCVTVCPGSKVRPRFLTSSPGSEVTPRFLTSSPRSEVTPTSVTSCAGKKVSPGYVTPDRVTTILTSCPKGELTPNFDGWVPRKECTQHPADSIPDIWVPRLDCTQHPDDFIPDIWVPSLECTQHPDDFIPDIWVPRLDCTQHPDDIWVPRLDCTQHPADLHMPKE